MKFTFSVGDTHYTGGLQLLLPSKTNRTGDTTGHLTHETENMWLLHFKYSHWWKRRSWSNFARGTNGVYMWMQDECTVERTLTTVSLFYLSCVRTRMNTKLIEIAICWGPRHIWLHTQLWGSVTTRHDFGGGTGRPLNTFFCALTISRSRLFARVWSGKIQNTKALV